MIFNRKKLISDFKWLKKKNLPMIISADYDGLICAAFLHHHLNWRIEGYYDLSNIWISKTGINNKEDLIWVDLNILPKQGKAIGGHIISIEGDVPIGFQSSCNPNILAGITSKKFNNKFPFSTLLYLLWIHNINIDKNLFSRMLILHADSTWLKLQHYNDNCKVWKEQLNDYNWNTIFNEVTTKNFEKQIDNKLYPILHNMDAISSKSKLKGKFYNTHSKQYQFNPDWDEDVIIELLNLFAGNLGWTPPKLPGIIKSIKGIRKKVPLALVKEIGISNFIKKNFIFSYSIPSPRIFNFTSFVKSNKSPISN